jgi:hypothetical protein
MEDLLTGVRLRVLDACGRTDEYLNLARAARAPTSYAGMLVKLGRTPEAMGYALKSFKRPDESLALATTLREAEAHDEALKIAEAGLALAGDDEDDFDDFIDINEPDDFDGIDDMEGSAGVLARWLRDYAAGLGRQALALKAAVAAFHQSLSLQDFRTVESCAGADCRRTEQTCSSVWRARLTALTGSTSISPKALIDEVVHVVGEHLGAAPTTRP